MSSFDNKRSIDSIVGPIVGVYMKPRYAAINTFVGEDFNPVNGLDIFIDLNTII